MAFPVLALGHGAISIGRLDAAVQDGIALGVAYDMRTEAEARAQSLQACKGVKNAPASARAMCNIVKTFRRQCVAIALDPDGAGESWGWATASTLADADKIALRGCRTSVTQFCVITVSGCDTQP
jgi:hypothetical protein